MSVVSGSTNSNFGQRKNMLTSTWDLLFDVDPKEWIGFKPVLGLHVYACYACRHMFCSVTSFLDHVNRRVLVLKYNCSGCSNEILTFYNRCSFLLHTRTHYSLNMGEINLRELDVFTLPVSLAGFLPHPNIPLLYEVQEDTVPENTYVNTQFYSPDANQRGNQVVTLKPNDIIFKQPQWSLVLKQICTNIPKCEFVTLEYQKLLRSRNLFAEENHNMRNPTLLSPMQIKEEPEEEPVQTVTVPNVEPIQTITMPVISKVESLKDKMFKLPRCLECNTFQRGTMAEHYLGKDAPIDNKLKCLICRFVASTSCALKAHIRIHESLAPYVCPDCGKDFPSWILLRQHMDDVCFHMAKHVRFRCPGKKCGKLFAMSSTFAAHFQVHLKCFFTCSVCSTVFFKTEDAENHKRLHKESCTIKKIFDCSLCTHLGTLTEENYKEHINEHTTDTNKCMYVYLCKYCRSYFRSTTTYATHLLKCSTKQLNINNAPKKYDLPRYITKDCETCSYKIIFSEEKPVRFCNKCKQVQKPKPVITKRYFCVLCNKQILPHEKGSHMKACKYGKPLVVIPKVYPNETENKSFSSTSSESSSSPTKFEKVKRHKSSDSSKTDDSMKKKRKRISIPGNNKHRKLEKEIEFDLTAEGPMHFDGTYHCKLCAYRHTERFQFHTHIKQHRDISTAYQCMECAECFVVKPSLIKHLLHFHNISDYESYLKENDCYDVDAVKELENIMRLAPGESKDPVKENQCKVCRQEFEDSITLNKHFRIHGMAFLLRNSK